LGWTPQNTLAVPQRLYSPSRLATRPGRIATHQLAAYLVWLTRNVADITSYMEIGCRWGGMFILTSEWIPKKGRQLRAVTAVDPIKPTPFIETYFDLLRHQSPIQATYLCDFSTSSAVRQAVDRIRPDFVFIDGDHELRGAFADHMLAGKHARIRAPRHLFPSLPRHDLSLGVPEEVGSA
jgi:hypothetical protein